MSQPARKPLPSAYTSKERWRMEEEDKTLLIWKEIRIIAYENRKQLKTFNNLANRTIEARKAFETAYMVI